VLEFITVVGEDKQFGVLTSDNLAKDLLQ